jgi:5-methylthioribose kinase
MMTLPNPSDELRDWLAEDGMIDPRSAVLESLGGGVSCDVFRVTDPDSGACFVAKRALAKLRVEADWFANVNRNFYEHRYLEVVGDLVPGAVPRVIHHNDERGYFCMEYLEGDWKNWKTELLGGTCEGFHAGEAGSILGRIHAATRENRVLAADFASDDNFFELRLDPYLVTTGKRHPELRDQFDKEVERIASTRQCLVHGDYSPKNILVNDRGIKVLDCEVAWFGDPSFDLAFLLNHLFLKSIYHAPGSCSMEGLFSAAIDGYFATCDVGPAEARQLDTQTARLLLMLLLARVDGKSPVEYLANQSAKQDLIRDFVRRQLSANPVTLTLSVVGDAWFAELNTLS